MMTLNNKFVITLLLITYCAQSLKGNPVVIKGSTPNGETFVAISTSDPEVEKYLSLNIPQESGSEVIVNPAPIAHGISIVGPAQASAGTGRSFVSSSAYNPFIFPLFNFPLNLEGLGLTGYGLPNNLFRSLENFYDPSVAGNGEIKSVAAINDNGHVYGKVNTVTFDNRKKN